MAGLDMNREYLVLLILDAEGKPTSLSVGQDPQLGTLVRLFSSREKLDRFLEYSPENQRFIDILEQEDDILEHFGSVDSNFGYSRITLPKLSPILDAYEVDHLQVDPLSPGAWQRVYPSPHKA